MQVALVSTIQGLSFADSRLCVQLRVVLAAIG